MAECRAAPNPELWYSEAEGDRAAALAVCARCTVAEPCRAAAAADTAASGIWGGVVWDDSVWLAAESAAEEAAAVARQAFLDARTARYQIANRKSRAAARAEWERSAPLRPARGRVPCPVCGRSYSRTRTGIVRHLRETHAGWVQPHVIDPDGEDLCAICHSGTAFSMHVAPAQHQYRPYICPGWDTRLKCVLCHRAPRNPAHTEERR